MGFWNHFYTKARQIFRAFVYSDLSGIENSYFHGFCLLLKRFHCGCRDTGWPSIVSPAPESSMQLYMRAHALHFRGLPCDSNCERLHNHRRKIHTFQALSSTAPFPLNSTLWLLMSRPWATSFLTGKISATFPNWNSFGNGFQPCQIN